MKKNTKLIAVLSLFSLVFVTLLASFVLSAFAVNSDIESGFGSGEVKYESTGIAVTGTLDFAEPGDGITRNFSIKNTGDTPFKYSFAIDLTRTTPLQVGEVGIENAIFVYIDNNYMGRLIDLTSDKYAYDAEFPLAPLDKSIHEITLEYHIDADTDYENDIHLDIDVEAISALNYDSDFVFVNNYNALQQYARKSNYQGRTIVLTGDITLEKDVELKVACNINLNSYKINLNGYKLSIAGTGINKVVKITNRVDADPVKSTSGYITANSNPTSKLIANTPNGLVLDYTGSDALELASNGYSKTMLADTYTAYLTELTKNGVSGNLNITDGFGIYFMGAGTTPLVLNSPSPSINFSVSSKTATMNITRLDLTQDEPVSITVDSVFRDISVRIWGHSDDARIDEYLEKVFGFANEANYSDDKNAYIVSSDIYLPKQIQSLGAQIIWRSSNPEIVNTNGKVIRPYKESLTRVELTAYITCNGITTSRSYSLYIHKKTAEEILKEIIYELESLLTFAYVYESKDNENVRELVSAEQYAHLGVTKLEYMDISDDYDDIFELNKEAPTLELIHDTVLTSAGLGLKIEVTDDLEVSEASGEAKIKIDINRTISIFDAMYNHLLTYIAHIENNTLNSFEVPLRYLEDGNSYKYYIFPGQHEIPETANEFTVNPLDVNNYATVSADHKQILINKYNAPNENTTITVLVELTSYEQTVYRTMKFDISGVLLLGRDILDDNLFYQLRQVIDRNPVHGNKDGFISRDEIDAIGLTSYTQTDSYIHSLVGLEYFTSLQTLNLSKNQITDISPLSNLTNLTELNLANNRIINVSKIDTLTNLTNLNLSNNEIIDISNLTYLESLVHLNLANNLGISDLKPINNMTNLTNLSVYNTASVNPTNLKFNLNYLITQHERIGAANAYFYVNNATTRWNPTTNEQNANNIVNYIEPISEIANVIVLPMQIEYDGVIYPIYWETNDKSSGIITIDEINGRAYVNQPITDVDITIYAYIKYGGGQEPLLMYRVMDILSRGNQNASLTLITADGTIYTDDEVRNLIPDSTLLQYLYTKYATNNIIDIRDLISSHANGFVDLNGLNIKSFDGIELFNDVIKELNVSNIFVEDFTPIMDLTSLTSLTATSGNIDVSQLTDFDNLSYLYIYGCAFIDSATGLKMDEYEALKHLYIVYKNNASNLIRVFQDATSEWNPYIVPTMDALTALQSIYVVSYNQPIVIPTSIVINMYGYENITVSLGANTINEFYTFQYVLTAARSGLASVTYHTLNVTTGAIVLTKIPPEDTYSSITATIRIINTGTQVVETSCKRNLLIMQLTEKELYLELADGTFVPFEGFFGDLELGKAVAALYINGNVTEEIDGVTYPCIMYSQLSAINTINLTGTNGGSIKGLELFIGSTSLHTINFTYFRGPGFSGSQRVNLSILSTANFPALKTITFANSYVYMPDLYNLSGLETLNIRSAIRVDFGTGPATMASFTNLKALTITLSDIKDFSFLKTLPRVSTLYIHDNPASTLAITDAHVMGAYNNYIASLAVGETPNYAYYVIDSKILWSPSDSSDVTDFNVVAKTSGGGSVYIDEPGRPGAFTAFDVIETITYLSASDTLYLPTNFGGSPIEWTSTSPYILGIDPGYIEDGCYVVPVNALNVKTYVRLIGRLNNKVLIYAFVIDNDGSAKINSPTHEGYVRFNIAVTDVGGVKVDSKGKEVPTQLLDVNNLYVIDLDVFMVDGVVEDPIFMNYMLGITNGFIHSSGAEKVSADAMTDNISGIFADSGFRLNRFAGSTSKTVDGIVIPTITLYNYITGNTATNTVMREFRFISVRGIKVFYNTTRFQMNSQEISDVSEARFLTNVVYFYIDSTFVTTLWYMPDGGSEPRSIFENYTALAYFTAIATPIENDDYMPLIYSDYGLTTLNALGVSKIINFHVSRTLAAANQSSDQFYSNERSRSLDKLFNKLYARAAANPTGSLSLRFSNTVMTNSNIGGMENMKNLASDMESLMKYEMPDRSYVLGDTIPSATVGTSQIYWSVEPGAFIKINDAGVITVNNSNVNGPVRIIGSIKRLIGSTLTTALSREFVINLTSPTRPDLANSKIWISAQEKIDFQTTIVDGEPYYPNEAFIFENGHNYVDAGYAIPDMSLRMSMYKYFDTSDDGTISELERYSTYFKVDNLKAATTTPHTVTYSASNRTLDLVRRNIYNIRGIELFPNLSGVQLAGNPITKIPKMMIPEHHILTRISFYYNNTDVGYASFTNGYLRDISNLLYDADPAGSKYRSLASYLGVFEMRNNLNLSGDQLKYLTNSNLDTNPNSPTYMQWRNNYPMLFNLSFTSNTIADYRYVPYLPHTLTTTTYLYTATGWGGGVVDINSVVRNFEIFALNSITSTAQKYLVLTSLQKEIDFDSVYYIGGAPVLLPRDVTIHGSLYKLGYTVESTATHQITKSGDDYYIEIKQGAPSEIQITAHTLFLNPLTGNTWLKSIEEKVTLQVETEVEIEDKITIECEGEIQLTDGGPFENLRVYVNDPIVRYWMMSFLDWGGVTSLTSAIRDGKISYSELLDIARLNRSRTFAMESSTVRIRGATDLSGIEILKDFGLEGIAISYSMISDFSLLGEFKTVTALTIRENTIPIDDMSFISKMTSLKTLNLYGTFYTNMNFLHESTSLEQLININVTGSEAVDAQYIRTEWAYARANGKLSELETPMLNGGGTDASYRSDASIKLAAEILDTLSFEFDTPLPEYATYNGKIYGDVAGAVENTSLKFVSVCGGIDIDPVTRIATNNHTRNLGFVLAILEYQGAFYERLFIADLA